MLGFSQQLHWKYITTAVLLGTTTIAGLLAVSNGPKLLWLQFRAASPSTFSPPVLRDVSRQPIVPPSVKPSSVVLVGHSIPAPAQANPVAGAAISPSETSMWSVLWGLPFIGGILYYFGRPAHVPVLPERHGYGTGASVAMCSMTGSMMGLELGVLQIGEQRYVSNDLSHEDMDALAADPQLAVAGPMNPVIITFVRHGETAENALGIIQGHTPTDLNENGLRQAKSVAKRIQKNYRDVCQIMTSDLPRARSTAEAIHTEYGAGTPFEVSTLLRERRLGIFETKLSKEARAYDAEVWENQRMEPRGPIFYDRLVEKHPQTKIEGRDEFLARGKQALRLVFYRASQYATEAAARTAPGAAQPVPHVVVVAHGQLMRIMLSLLTANPHLLPADPQAVAWYYAAGQKIGEQFTWQGDKIANTALCRLLLQVQPVPGGATDEAQDLFFTKPSVLTMNNAAHLESFLDPDRGGE